MSAEIILLALAFLVVAMLYASVGHGGASGYLAVFSIAGYSLVFAKTDALILNIIVSGIAFWQYFKRDYFDIKLLDPLILGSIPMALIGGYMHPDLHWYKIILGGLLAIPALLFFIQLKGDEKPTRKMPIITALIIGMVLGFVSGLTGIGGGVFLSPILILGGWAGQKQTAALSAPFIFVNSVSGLVGSMAYPERFDLNVAYFAVACVAGGFIGSTLGAGRFNPRILKAILAVVLFIASWKLLFT